MNLHHLSAPAMTLCVLYPDSRQTDSSQSQPGKEGLRANERASRPVYQPMSSQHEFVFDIRWSFEEKSMAAEMDTASPGPSDRLSNSAESVMESKCTQTAEDDAGNFMSYYYRVFLTP